MNLVVKEEGAKEEEEANSLESNPIKLDDFGEYVCEMHANNNTGFLLQFQVLVFCPASMCVTLIIVCIETIYWRRKRNYSSWENCPK